MRRWADIAYQRGTYDEALRIRRNIQLPVYERLATPARRRHLGQNRRHRYQCGDYGEANELHQRRLDVYTQLGDLDGIAAAEWGLALIDLQRRLSGSRAQASEGAPDLSPSAAA